MGKWVACSERLPEERVDVLFWIIRPDIAPEGWCEVGYLRDRDWHVNGNDYDFHDVTHWQPLPEPPK